MSGPRLTTQVAGPSKALRLILLINFLLVAAWLGPLGSERLYRALRSAGLAGTEVLLEQIWIIASTLVATALFIRELIGRSRRRAGGERASRSLAIDGVLLFAWWATLIGICGYAFMLGMAG
jgi:hypothetical protein